MSSSMSPTSLFITYLPPILLPLYPLPFFYLLTVLNPPPLLLLLPLSPLFPLLLQPLQHLLPLLPLVLILPLPPLQLNSLEHFPPLRRTARPIKKPPFLQDYVCSTAIPTFADPFAFSTLTPFCSFVQLHQLPSTSLVHSQAFLSLTEP